MDALFEQLCALADMAVDGSRGFDPARLDGVLALFGGEARAALAAAEEEHEAAAGGTEAAVEAAGPPRRRHGRRRRQVPWVVRRRRRAVRGHRRDGRGLQGDHVQHTPLVAS